MTRPRRYALAATLLAAAIGAVVATAATSTDSGSVGTALRATAKYHDVAIARSAGYGVLKDKNGVACIAMDGMPAMGAMGVHYVNGPLVADGKIAVAAPEALVYAPTHGRLELAALEYVVLKQVWDAHHTARPALFGHAFQLTPAGNRFGLPAFYSLHAWIWKPNPSGEFAMWNPTVSCR